MNVKCNRAALAETLQLASSIVPIRTPKPVLECAKLEALPGNIFTVTATDNELSVKYLVSSVEVVEPGVAVLPAERIASIVRESTGDTITLEVKDATCEVKGHDSFFHVYGHDPNDFPELRAWEGEVMFGVNAGVLRRMIHRSAFAAARENTRYAINGVLWEVSGKKLRMVATDGRRLAQVDGDVESVKKSEQTSAIVPVKTMQAMEKILTDADEKVEIGFTANQFGMSSSRAELCSNLIQGRFPKYSDVIPSGCKCKAQIEVEHFRSAVRQAALLATEQSNGVLLEFDNNELCIRSSTPEAGDAEVTLAVKYEGEALKIGFNPQYLLELFRVIDEPEVVAEFEDGARPGLIRIGKDFLYVLMPVTV